MMDKTLWEEQLKGRGYRVLEVISRRADGRWVVLKTEDAKGTLCATRVLGRPDDRVPAVLADHLRDLAVKGIGSSSGLPQDLSLTIEGYRVRARLGDRPGLAAVVDAGVTLEGSDFHAFPYLSTRWATGSRLDRVWPSLPIEDRHQVLISLLEILTDMHSDLAVFGDLKPANIIVGEDGSLRLIDLDTIREVSDRLRPVLATDLTPRYAAPEQHGNPPLLWLASDLWAYGKIVGAMLRDMPVEDVVDGADLPSPWDDIVGACLRSYPGDRPATDRLLARARGQEVDLAPPTDNEQTIRVPEPTPAFEELTEAPSSSSIGRFGTALIAIFIAVVGGLGAFIVADFYLKNQQAQRLHNADLLAVETMDQLRAFKTDFDLNKDSKILEDIVVKAQQAVDIGVTPSSTGVLALAQVWNQKWHWSGARWDPQKFAEGEQIIEPALVDRPTALALLARGMLTGAACRLMGESAPERAAHCAESRRRFSQTLDILPQDDTWAWLIVETHWAAAMVENRESSRKRQSGDKTQAGQHSQWALDHCTKARPIIEQAPVNGPEMAEDCIVAAGVVQDFEAYLDWAAWLGAQHPPANNIDARYKRRLNRIYRAASPQCANLKAANDGRPAPVSGSKAGGFEDLCSYLGLSALGCFQDASAYRVCRKRSFFVGCVDWVEEPGVPWRQAITAVGKSQTGPCPLP